MLPVWAPCLCGAGREPGVVGCMYSGKLVIGCGVVIAHSTISDQRKLQAKSCFINNFTSYFNIKMNVHTA